MQRPLQFHALRPAARGVLACALVLSAAPSVADDPPPGFTRYAGRHLVLLTDLPPAPELAELPELFDAAVPQWAQFCRLEAAQADGWQVTAHLMRSRERFAAAGLLPDDLPEFEHAYARNDRVWLDEPSTLYYLRHLLLHEGTHAFMFTYLEGAGPPWYSEGVAELLATHRWRDRELALAVFPQTADDVAGWGRIELVRSDVAAGRARSLTDVFAYDDRAHRQVEAYAWSWAAATFLAHHPGAAQIFERLPALVHRKGFNAEFRRRLGKDWPQLADQWALFSRELVYGYDFRRSAVDLTPAADEVPRGGARSVTIVADRGWQNSGLRLAAGRYALAARGRFTIHQTDRPWPCEARGVTIRYHQGRPLGIVLAVVRPDVDDDAARAAALAAPASIGAAGELVVDQAGTLLLRVNDSPAELAENSGQLEVTIRAAGEGL